MHTEAAITDRVSIVHSSRHGMHSQSLPVIPVSLHAPRSEAALVHVPQPKGFGVLWEDSKAHLEEDPHQSVHDITAALHCWDVPGGRSGNGVAVELACEVQHTPEVLVSVDQGQLSYPWDTAFEQKHLENPALCPLQQKIYTMQFPYCVTLSFLAGHGLHEFVALYGGGKQVQVEKDSE